MIGLCLSGKKVRTVELRYFASLVLSRLGKDMMVWELKNNKKQKIELINLTRNSSAMDYRMISQLLDLIEEVSSLGWLCLGKVKTSWVLMDDVLFSTRQ